MNGSKLAIIDAGVGNVVSISSMLRRAGILHEIVDEPAKLAYYDRILLAGVGSFGALSENLVSRGFERPLREYITNPRFSLLGVCAGAQVLFGSSEEAPNARGLGLVAGRVRKVLSRESHAIPRIGWDYLEVPDSIHDNNSFIAGILANGNRFFFSHSYCIEPDDSSIVLASCRSAPTIPAVFVAGNVLGVQFHPERSGVFGSTLLRNFAEGRLVVTANHSDNTH